MLTIDGLQYSNWSREIFEQMRAGGVTAVLAPATASAFSSVRKTARRLKTTST